MSFKSEDEAKGKQCIFRLMIMMLSQDECVEDFDKCVGNECAQYGKGAHRCGLV